MTTKQNRTWTFDSARCCWKTPFVLNNSSNSWLLTRDTGWRWTLLTSLDYVTCLSSSVMNEWWSNMSAAVDQSSWGFPLWHVEGFCFPPCSRRVSETTCDLCPWFMSSGLWPAPTDCFHKLLSLWFYYWLLTDVFCVHVQVESKLLQTVVRGGGTDIPVM